MGRLTLARGGELSVRIRPTHVNFVYMGQQLGDSAQRSRSGEDLDPLYLVVPQYILKLRAPLPRTFNVFLFGPSHDGVFGSSSPLIFSVFDGVNLLVMG